MVLGYLINPALQVEDVNGKPLTGGFLRVYHSGTTIKYITDKNFTGDKNPFEVVLDNKGMAVLLADVEGLYDVYCYDKNGVEQWSRLKVKAGYGVYEDSTELLDWFRGIGSTVVDTNVYKPGTPSGTMEMGTYGPVLQKDCYYHATVHVRATKADGTREPYYDNINLNFKLRDSQGNVSAVATATRMVDYSTSLSQEFEFSCDTMPEADSELILVINGQDVLNGAFEIVDIEVHRVYSGAPVIPGGIVTKEQVQQDYQRKLTAGNNINITNNVISAADQQQSDWTQSDSSAVDYIKHKPSLATVATSGNYNDLSNKPNLSNYATTSQLATKQDTLIAGTNITIEDNVISATGGGGGGGGTTYTAGNGIVINDDEISVDTGVVQEKLSTAEMNAVDSGINSTKVSAYDTHVADTTIHVTSTDKTNWNAKEDASNKKQSIDDSSTTDYPSSKAVADFVNSSVATATARFLGSFTLTDLGLTYGATNAQIATALDNHTWPSGTTPTNNDYVYVEIQDPQTTGIDDEVRRFKFNGTVWAYEYTLNNSSFTAAEKAAIDSGITSTLVTAYNNHVADSTIHVTSSDKSAWNAKQDAISDLATIRSGASAGATAVQPGDIDQTYNSSSTSAQSGTAVAGAIAGVRQVPTTQSTDNGKVLGVTDANGTLGWVAQSGGGAQVQADWTETDTTDPSYIQHKPTELGLSAGTNITLTESGNSLTISANFTQVQSDWEETNTASPAYLAGKPLITRLIPGTLSDNSTNSDLMAICDLVDQYSSSGDVLLVKGSWTGATDAMWRFIEKFQSNQNMYTYLFKLIVEDLCVAYVYIIYDTARPTAYIDYASTENLSTQTLYSGRCININYNQSTHHDEINWTTTAGITDIQQVAALPANPVSTVLYLIPAT